MRRITEEDVVLYNEHIIREASLLYGRSLDPEDRLMAANEGFLYAIRCYQKGVSQFQPFAKAYMHQQIKNEVKEFNRARRIESSLSLDQQIKTEENSGSIGNTFFQAPGDFVNSVIFQDFLNSLERELKIIALMYIEKYTSKEIMRIRNISKKNWRIRQNEFVIYSLNMILY